MIFKYFFCFLFLFSYAEASNKKQVLVDGELGLRRFIELLEKSSQSVQPVMVGAFKLHQGSLPRFEILKTLKQLTQKKTVVHVFLESRLTKEERRFPEQLSLNQSLNAYKDTNAVIIKDVLPYKNVHMKFLLSDDFALIGTTNYDDDFSKYVKRDFSLLTENISIIRELRNILEKVEKRESIEWPYYNIEDLEQNETRLSWGPPQHQKHLLQLIHRAKHTILIYQQDLQDILINQAIEKVLKNKVQIFILMSHHPFGKKNKNKSLPFIKNLIDKGASVCLTGKKKVYKGVPLHVHAKVLLVDAGTKDQIMYLGSANFYGPVLNPQGYNLNLGLMTRDDNYIKIVHETFLKDWKAHDEAKK